MPRITLDIDPEVLREVNALQRREGRSLGSSVSELLAEALALRKQELATPRLEWISRPMGARANLEDRDAVDALLDETGA